MSSSPPVLLVFSHLRWGFVYQRPQHLLSRLAGRWKVFFVEEPVRCDGPAWLEVQVRAPHLTVLVPHTPVAAGGFHDDQVAVLQALLAEPLRACGQPVALAWLYTPMALPLQKAVAPQAGVVYDCMDELAAFKNAPRQLRQRESALLKCADLVLTGGPSLFEAKQALNANVYCIPSAVDAAHFAPSRLQPGCEHDRHAERALAGLPPGPRLGFFGVIDERMDIGLLAHLADAHPEWNLVMAGPVVKIDPEQLPQRPNIRWLGMQSYEQLPYLLSRWDICLMPFALNEATRFISPTKTLEYMAGEKPVVSTAVRDVIWLYGEAVAVANGPTDFVRACEKLLAEDAAARVARGRDMLNMVSMHSWDRSADSVQALLAETLARTSSPSHQRFAWQAEAEATDAVPAERAERGGVPPRTQSPRPMPLAAGDHAPAPAEPLVAAGGSRA